MRIFKRFLLMLQFLTTIPIKINLDVNEEDFGKGLVYAPVVGLVIGAILAGEYFVLSRILPQFITIVLIIISYILLTGGLHLDGLGDTFDGLFSNRSRERMLEIMRDSRVGTNAVLAIFGILAMNIAVLGSIKPDRLAFVLLLMPVAGRIGSLVGAGTSQYARRGEGLGKSFIDFCGRREVLIGNFIADLIFLAAMGWNGLGIAVFSAMSALVTAMIFSRRIGGATGDILGAVCEINQTIFLLAVCVLQNRF
ncbi:MAG: adenosylcobinamide-GDP ribazoletransferase [Clostridia bacterium]|nr:adenosylcobinamide-GDP ribazoletransferase [Clostridia bacterium]